MIDKTILATKLYELSQDAKCGCEPTVLSTGTRDFLSFRQCGVETQGGLDREHAGQSWQRNIGRGLENNRERKGHRRGKGKPRTIVSHSPDRKMLVPQGFSLARLLLSTSRSREQSDERSVSRFRGPLYITTVDVRILPAVDRRPDGGLRRRPDPGHLTIYHSTRHQRLTTVVLQGSDTHNSPSESCYGLQKTGRITYDLADLCIFLDAIDVLQQGHSMVKPTTRKTLTLARRIATNNFLSRKHFQYDTSYLEICTVCAVGLRDISQHLLLLPGTAKSQLVAPCFFRG